MVDGVARPVAGAQVAIVRDRRVLLQLRPWPPGWELPGGHVAPGEDPALCAAREAEEETGYRVRIVTLVGLYRWAGLRRAVDALYLGEVAGGRPRRSVESLASRFVTPGEAPRSTFPWFRQRIADALAAGEGWRPVERVQPVGPGHVLFFGGQWAGALVDWWRRSRRAAGR